MQAGHSSEDTGVDFGALLSRVSALLSSIGDSTLQRFMACWPSPGPRRGAAATPPPAAASLPVLKWLPRIGTQPLPYAAAVITALCRIAPALSWRQTYPPAEVGAAFLDNYAYVEVMGLGAPVPSERLACGFLLLGPHTGYPRHHHEAEEIYVPLSGDTEWLQGDEVWRRHAPGTLIHHARDEPHAMQTRNHPLLALYLWHSENLAQKARLDARPLRPT